MNKQRRTKSTKATARAAIVLGASPFPFKTPKGRTILDERCRCGHLRSEHGPRFAYGYGACEARASSNHLACDCHQFTWASFVEAAS
jgi:hypothetical protein